MTGILLLTLLAPSLADGLEADLARSGIRRSGLGVLVGPAGGRPLLAVNPDELRIPASNQKLVTAAAAIKLLGAGFRFRTVVGRTPRNGGFGGEVVVVGDGDPNFSGRFYGGDPNVVLRGLARDIRSRGVRRIPTLVVDATRFDDEYIHPDWPRDQLDRWYCAPVGALVYNDSCWDVTVTPAMSPGRPALIDVQPALLRPDVLNRCSTVAGGRHVVHIARGAHGLEVKGSILKTSRGITGNVTVRDPIGFFARSLKAALEAEGVRVQRVRVERRTHGDAGGDAGGKKKRELEPLVVLRSDLRRSLRVVLKDSQNLYAECIFKRLGDGTFAGGSAAAERSLRGVGVEPGELEIRDGSGMARTNRATPRALWKILQALREEPVFVDGLAAGGEGTLRRRYRNLADRVRAKTGTLRGVTALSGYVTGRPRADGQPGRRFVFVILANGRSVARARRFQDLIVNRLANAR